MKAFKSKIVALRLADKANKARKIKDLYKVSFYGTLSRRLYNLPSEGWYIVNRETNKIL